MNKRYERNRKRFITRMLEEILELEKKAIFVQRLRLYCEGPKLILRVGRMRNSFGEDDMKAVIDKFRFIFWQFWVSNRIDKFMLDIDLTLGQIDVTYHDWGIVYSPEIFRVWNARYRPPVEDVMEAYLYDEPEDWFPNVVETSESLSELLQKLGPKGDQWGIYESHLRNSMGLADRSKTVDKDM